MDEGKGSYLLSRVPWEYTVLKKQKNKTKKQNKNELINKREDTIHKLILHFLLYNINYLNILIQQFSFHFTFNIFETSIKCFLSISRFRYRES